MKSNDINDRLLGMIGLAARARMLAAGTELSCDSVRSGNARLLMVAHDASANTKKRVFNCARYYEVACYEIPIGQNDLGHAIGKKGVTSALAVTDSNMTNGIEKLLKLINEQTSEAVSKPREV